MPVSFAQMTQKYRRELIAHRELQRRLAREQLARRKKKKWDRMKSDMLRARGHTV
jgi:hypothetical protein